MVSDALDGFAWLRDSGEAVGTRDIYKILYDLLFVLHRSMVS